jgi:hypothetical protein
VLEGGWTERRKETDKGIQQRDYNSVGERKRSGSQGPKTSQRSERHAWVCGERWNRQGKKDKEQLRVGPRTAATQEAARREEQRPDPSQCRNGEQQSSHGSVRR